MPFDFLRTPVNPMRKSLEYKRGTLPLNEVVQFVPQIVKLEYDRVLAELKGSQSFSFTFDGTMETAEMEGVVVRFVSSNNNITHRLLSIKFLAQSMTGVEIARLLLLVLNIQGNMSKIRWGTRDGASANTVAMSNIRNLFDWFFDIICLCHSINVAGSIFHEECSTLDYVINLWSAMVSISAIIRRRFLEISNKSALHKSNVRWYSWYEVAEQMREHYATILLIMNDNTNGNDKQRANFVAYNDLHRHIIQIELALICDSCKPMVETCYLLEGDSFVAPIAFDMWHALILHGRCITGRNFGNNPPVAPTLRQACVDAAGAGQGDENILFIEAIAKAIPIFDKLEADTNDRLANQLNILRACRIFDLRFVAREPVEVLNDEIEIYFQNVPFLNNLIPDLLQSLSIYKKWAIEQKIKFDALPAGTKVSPEMLWSFWKTHRLKNGMQIWYVAASEVATIMVSSCCIERIFSLWCGMFHDSQKSLLSDKQEGGIMLRFNKNQREKDANDVY